MAAGIRTTQVVRLVKLQIQLAEVVAGAVRAVEVATINNVQGSTAQRIFLTLVVLDRKSMLLQIVKLSVRKIIQFKRN